MSLSQRRGFTARLAELPPAIEFVEAFCLTHATATVDALRLVLMVEELFTNTVTHGHGGDCDATVHLGLDLGDTTLTLVYEDAAPYFDPLEYVAAHAHERVAGLDARPIGHLGLPLVLEMASSVSHEWTGEGNRLHLVLLRSG